MISDVIFGFLITWVLGLLPAYVLRFEMKKKPFKKRYAVLLAALIWFVHLLLIAGIKLYTGDESRIGSAIGLVAFVSFIILIYKNDDEKNKSK